MKTRLLLATLPLFFFCSIYAYAQADLTLSYGSVQTLSVSTGDLFVVKCAVQNIGNQAAGTSHLKIFISPTLNTADALKGSSVSVEALAQSAISNEITFAILVPDIITTGSYYVLYSVDDRNEVVESNSNNNLFYDQNMVSITHNSNSTSEALPYPIIFIHGLIGNGSSWADFASKILGFYGFSNGGTMNFCLNYDGDIHYALMPNDYHDFTNVGSLKKADYYFVNFAVDHFGNYDPNLSASSSDESNQSAIVKQGYAISDAIKHVLKITGSEKVILVGHSMGGLAAREYLQNSSRWQSDSKHHVAKLMTCGTPHGGSNSSTWINLDGIGGSPDQQSEAVRDLKNSYGISGDPGVYLFGGLEAQSVMWYNLLYNYHNIDVNCNGFIGNSITGLNTKPIDTSIPYSCVIGTGQSFFGGTGVYGDGIVESWSANINTYYPTLAADTFMIEYPGGLTTTPFHGEIRKSDYGKFNVQGLDEPLYFSQAYRIDSTRLFFGNITPPSLGSSQIINNSDYHDYDVFSFVLNQTGNVDISVYDIPVSNFYMQVYNSSNTSTPIISIASNGRANIVSNGNSLQAGTYYLAIIGLPDERSWLNPYGVYLSFPSCQPPASVANIYGIDSVCENSSQTYTCSLVPGATSYSWTLPSGWNGFSKSNSIIATVGSNSGYICVAANNSCGSSNYICGVVTAKLVPFPPVTILGNTSVCQNTSHLYSVTPIGGATNYTWTLPSGWSGSSTINSINTTAGNNSGMICVTANNSCGSSGQSCIFDTVNSKPSAIINLNGNTLTSSCTTSGCNYQWYKDGNPTCTNSLTCAITGDGGYYVVITDGNGCSATSTTSVITNLEEKENSNLILIYPNPTSGKITVGINKVMTDASLIIYNSLGEEIYTDKMVSKGNYSKEIDLKAVAGIYFLRVNDGENIYLQKIVIQ